MQFEEIKSVSQIRSPQLKALWHAKKGNWEAAHEIAQSEEGTWDYDRIHAYLHRLEGDIFNAGWWYNRINVEFPKISLDQEWAELWEKYSA
ncbi:hypothetical protein LAG90_19040 [Marinilongibacter aquaticus]|uniref:hypothetical protein n=1 Tax=Marinilongibacter aquaticus TaxID=2975157 RepID=UPI0021BDB170|nr:hypothetical protein [Marinilongibacter aquaticus]UBM58897.1 hypothetical protein LAG90_19040 [Marinilongibacter aquaticus]